jgi:AraC-like DNA-binding protein
MIQAALEAGFGSYPQFHRVFRQTHGVGPQAFFPKSSNP